jgi:hypothetical protein
VTTPRLLDLVVLAPPVPRTADRVAALFGDLVEAPVVITQGAQLPLAGLLFGVAGVGDDGAAARRRQGLPADA